MSTEYVLFFILPFEEKDKVPKEDIKIPRGVKKIFHYLNMYICILEDKDLERKTFTPKEVLETLADQNLIPEEEKFLEALAGELSETKNPSEIELSKAMVSQVKTNKIIMPIIQSIVSQLPNDFTFRWMITELDKIKSPTGPLTEPSEGAGGGGNG